MGSPSTIRPLLILIKNSSIFTTNDHQAYENYARKNSIKGQNLLLLPDSTPKLRLRR